MKTIENIPYTYFYRLQTTFACGGVFVDDSWDVVYTCPIYRWMIGRNFNYCLTYLVENKREPMILEIKE